MLYFIEVRFADGNGQIFSFGEFDRQAIEVYEGMKRTKDARGTTSFECLNGSVCVDMAPVAIFRLFRAEK